jgi:hypothetical protein
MIGAVNLLIDVTDRQKSLALRDQAARCRRLASYVNDPQTEKTLRLMAADYDEQASTIGRTN